jgi:ribosomal protein S25
MVTVIAIVNTFGIGMGIAEIVTRQLLFGRTVITTETETTTVVRL